MYRRCFSSSSPLPISTRSFGPLAKAKVNFNQNINAQKKEYKDVRHFQKREIEKERESFEVVSKKCAVGLLNLNHAIPIHRREPLNWNERTVKYRDELCAWTQRFGLADLRIKSLACALDHSPFDVKKFLYCTKLLKFHFRVQIPRKKIKDLE